MIFRSTLELVHVYTDFLIVHVVILDALVCNLIIIVPNYVILGHNNNISYIKFQMATAFNQ